MARPKAPPNRSRRPRPPRAALSCLWPLAAVLLTPCAARAQASLPEIRERVIGSIRSIENLYIEYEVFVEGKQVLSISEAVDPKRRWTRTTHYYGILYDNTGRPSYDPLLNWIYWDGGRRTLLREATRLADIDYEPAIKLSMPLVEGYFGHVGLLTAGYVLDPSADPSVPFRAEDYYFPGALLQDGWRVRGPGPGSPDGQTLLERTISFGSDQLVMNPRRDFALDGRKIYDKNGALVLDLEFSGHRRVLPHLWLPTEIRSTSRIDDKKVRVYKVSRVEAYAAAAGRAFGHEFPPGTIVEDRTTGKRYQLPGGEDLLEFTLEKMRFFLDTDPASRKASRPASALRSAWVYPLAAALLLSPVLWYRVGRTGGRGAGPARRGAGPVNPLAGPPGSGPT